MKIEGETLRELFQAGLLGMSRILCEQGCGKEKEWDKRAAISLTAPDLTCLLVDFLSEVLSLTYTEKALFCKMEDIKISETAFSATLLGTRLAKLDEEIKAVTYHEAQVDKNAVNVWETRIVFDI
ncbi:MAG: hypothetical protein GTN53_23635 [Candidatus Aminicenantes bacterium]|nr:hypothetical protein [Candidatus Aminicenantes bacterium]NIT25498.1 hypothetical protein [Candidatus Aminicenantes bacterium]